jgi:TRAP transporter TAXI family solute receptor
MTMAGLSRRAVIAGGAAMLAVSGSRAWSQDARFFLIATGPTESGYFAIGSLVGGIVSSPPGARDCDRGGSCGVPGLIAVTHTTAGAAANVEEIRQRRADSALCQADIAYWALHGTGPYRRQGAAGNLRAIANLYREALHVVVRRGTVREFRQLRGKAVSLGERDSATMVTARTVLPALGLVERDLRAQFLTPVDAADALREGKIDAFFPRGGLPSQLIADLASRVDIALLAVEAAAAAKLKATSPYFTETTIAASAYRGVAETATVSVGVLWIVDADADERLVYGLARALWHPNNRRALDSGHPYGRSIRRETAIDGVAIQFHPGAARYYAEVGLIK